LRPHEYDPQPGTSHVNCSYANGVKLIFRGDGWLDLSLGHNYSVKKTSASIQGCSFCPPLGLDNLGGGWFH
jgi:hypothetical protein